MCDTIVIRSKDRMFFAKNSDRDPNEAQILEWHAAREYPAEATVRCTWIEIPQVRRTHAVLVSRPFWMWGAEMGANEHGVVIGNEAVFTTESRQAIGLTGMDLLRLALERASTARSAVDVLISLLATHGQGGGCGHENRRFTYHNSFLVADPNEAYVLETAGREHAIEPVTGARTISNGLTIESFARRYSDRLKTGVSACRTRQRRSTFLATESKSVAELLALLRDHGGSPEPQYSLVNGGMSSVCMHAGGVVAGAQTTSSWVCEMTADTVQHWVTGTAAPCVSLFKPVAVEMPIDLGSLPTDQADEDSLWWRWERLHRMVMRNPARLMPIITPERDRQERDWLVNTPTSAEAFAIGDVLLTEWIERILEEVTEDVRPLWLRRYWSKRNQMAGLRPMQSVAKP